METIVFTIYRPNNKTVWLTPDSLIYTLIFAGIGFFWFAERILKSGNTFDSFKSCYLVLTVILSIYFIIASFFTYKPLKGKLDGTIEFKGEDIVLNDIVYNLKDISNLDFNFGDYYGESSQNGRSFNPKLYQGVNNYVTFTNSDNHEHLIYFKLLTKNSYRSLSPFINEAIKLKKMEFKRGIDLLGIENVSIN